MVKGGIVPLTLHEPRSLADIVVHDHHYTDLATMPGWRDFRHRMKRIRDGARDQLERGMVDKMGKNHDDELRILIHTLNSLLAHPDNLRARREESEKSLAKLHARQPGAQAFVS